MIMLGPCFLHTGQWPGILQWEVAAPRARWPASWPLRALGTCTHSPGRHCRAGYWDSPSSCSGRALGTRQPSVGAEPRQVTQGPAALALVLLHSWNLRCPIGMLMAAAMGLCAPGGRVGSLSPSPAPGGKEQREHAHWTSSHSLYSVPGAPRPAPPIFSKKPVSWPPIPKPSHNRGFYGTRALGDWTLCTVAAAPCLAGDQRVTLASGSGWPAHARLRARIHVTGKEARAPETGRDKPKFTQPQTGTKSLSFITVTTTPSPCGGFSSLGTCSMLFLPRPQAPGSCSGAQSTFTEGC